MIPQQAVHRKLGDYEDEEEKKDTTAAAAAATAEAGTDATTEAATDAGIDAATPGPSQSKKTKKAKKTVKPTLKTTYKRDEEFRDQLHLFIALPYAPSADVKDIYQELRAMQDLHPKLEKYLDNYFEPTWICNGDGNSGRYSVESWNVHEM